MKRILFFTVFLIFCFLKSISGSEIAVKESVCDSKKWALATSAILTERNGQRHDLLGGSEPTPEVIKEWKKILVDWWGINNRVDLLQDLIWLQEEGHRYEFDKTANYISSISDEEFDKIMKSFWYGTEQKDRFRIVKENYERLGQKSILAWDLIRYILLCRWGYLVGYLSEQEAWDKIMPIARQLQKTFVSWKDLEENYFVGRSFWQTTKDSKQFKQIYDKFMDDPTSAWNSCPWQTELE